MKTSNLDLGTTISSPLSSVSLTLDGKSIKVSPILSPLRHPTYPGNFGGYSETFNKVSGSKPPRLSWKYSVGGAGGLCGANTSEITKL